VGGFVALGVVLGGNEVTFRAVSGRSGALGGPSRQFACKGYEKEKKRRRVITKGWGVSGKKKRENCWRRKLGSYESWNQHVTRTMGERKRIKGQNGGGPKWLEWDLAR